MHSLSIGVCIGADWTDPGNVADQEGLMLHSAGWSLRAVPSEKNLSGVVSTVIVR